MLAAIHGLPQMVLCGQLFTDALCGGIHWLPQMVLCGLFTDALCGGVHWLPQTVLCAVNATTDPPPPLGAAFRANAREEYDALLSVPVTQEESDL